MDKNSHRFLVLLRDKGEEEDGNLLTGIHYLKYTSAPTREIAISNIDADSNEGDEYILVDTAIQGAGAVLGFYRVENHVKWYGR